MIAVPCVLLARVAFWCRGQCVMVAAPFLRAEWVSTLVCGGLPCLFIATFAPCGRTSRRRTRSTRKRPKTRLSFRGSRNVTTGLSVLNIICIRTSTSRKKVTSGGPFSYHCNLAGVPSAKNSSEKLLSARQVSHRQGLACCCTANKQTT